MRWTGYSRFAIRTQDFLGPFWHRAWQCAELRATLFSARSGVLRLSEIKIPISWLRRVLRSGISWLGHALLVVLGYAAALAVGHHVFPRPPVVTTPVEKRALASREQCQVLFVGPSYVWKQIEPPHFDAEARRIGLPLKSCIFGRNGLRGFEMHRDIQRLLEHDWPRLELVVIDTTLGDRIGFESGNWFKARMLKWHTLTAVPWLLSYYGRDKRSWAAKAPKVVSHLLHVVGNYSQAGRGAELLADRLVDQAAVAEEKARRKAKRIKRPLPVKHPDYDKKLKHLKRAKVRIHKHSERRVSHWEVELRELVRAHGVEAYFLYAPVWSIKRPPAAIDRTDDPLIHMDFNDPVKYPDLYVESVRGKTSHLRGAGNAAYSKLLARRLLEIRSTR